MKKIFLALLLMSSQQLFANTCPASIPGYSFVGERNGHKYFQSEANFNHAQASAAAAALGGYMASIVESSENTFLQDRINKIVRIGLSDSQTEGFLQWDSGEDFRLNNINNASNSADEGNDFANMNFWNGGWEMEGKFVARPYLLEIPCDDDGNICPVPTIITTETTPTNPAGVLVVWSPLEEADSFTVEYTNTVTGSTLTQPTTFSNTRLVNGIELGQNYSIKVRSNCLGQQSAFSNTVIHTTEEGSADVSLGSFRNLRAVPPNAPNAITADMTIFNGGLLAATFELRTYLSTDNVLSSDDIRLNLANEPAGTPEIITLSCCFTNSEVGGVYSIPGGLASGNYFFIAVIDEDNQVPGVSGTLSRQVTIDPAPQSLPDLFISLISFDQAVVSPSSLQLDYQVGNFGNSDANGTFNVEIYISPNDSNPANDILLATRTISGGVPRAGNKSDSVNLSIPANLAAGEYRFVFIADSDNQIAELSDSNNSIRIFDLTEGDNNTGGGNPDGNECPGNITNFSDLGELGGSKYYLSDDTENWEAARSITRSHQGYLASINNAAENTFLKERIDEIVLVGLTDQENEGTFIWDSGEGLTYSNITGSNNSEANDFSNMNFWNGGWDFDNKFVSRRFIMEVECTGDGDGSNTGGGNTGGGEGKPDLNVSNISSVPSGVAGEVLNFNFDLNNFEPVIASESYRIGMYVSQDSTLSSDDTLAGIVPTGNTPEGTISGVPAAITVPFGLTPGNYFLIINADIDNDVDETNENNNTVSRNFTVNAGQLSGVDVELNVSVDKSSLQAFTNYTFTITALNRGPERVTNLEITFMPTDFDNMPFVEVEVSKGESAGWSHRWSKLDLNAGESATLDVTYFFLNQTTTSSLHAFARSADQDDIDSTFGNTLNPQFSVTEDDEAIASVVGGIASCNDPNQLFAFVGQSNMAGQGEKNQSPVPATGTAFEYHIQSDSIISLEDSTGEWWGLPSNNNHKLSAASSGSLLPAFAIEFNNLTGKKLTAIHTARGGAGWFYEFADFGNWQPGGQTMTAALHKIDAGISRSGLPLTGIVLLGGETDTVTNFGNNFVEADFKEGMRKVMRTFRQKYNAPLYFILPGWTTLLPNQFKDPATLEARRFMTEVYNEPEFSSFTRVIYSDISRDILNVDDPIHYSQAGYNTVGKNSATSLAQQQICSG